MELAEADGEPPSPRSRRLRRSGSLGAPVKLHVYDASWLASTTLPIVHLGVEIYGCEFSFGDAGVRSFKPGTYDTARHRATLLLGVTQMRRREVYGLLVKMKSEYPGERYRLVGCNCQTFAEVLCERLGLGSCIPEEYVYFAKPFKMGVDLSAWTPQLLASNLGSGSGSKSSSSGCGLGCEYVESTLVEEAVAIGAYPSVPAGPAPFPPHAKRERVL